MLSEVNFAVFSLFALGTGVVVVDDVVIEPLSVLPLVLSLLATLESFLLLLKVLSGVYDLWLVDDCDVDRRSGQIVLVVAHEQLHLKVVHRLVYCDEGLPIHPI